MDRRAFFQRAALIAAGTVAADQFDLLERLLHKRRLFPSAAIGENPLLWSDAQSGITIGGTWRFSEFNNQWMFDLTSGILYDCQTGRSFKMEDSHL